MLRHWLKLLLPGAVLLVLGIPSNGHGQDRADIAGQLPRPAEWIAHLERDILPFWRQPAALGDPVGNFPTNRCNDGSVYRADAPCPEFVRAPQWIRNGLDRHYVRMASRQTFLYGVAYHLTGDEEYLLWSRAGARYIIDHALDRETGSVVTYFEDGQAGPAPGERTSQDLAYALLGPAFYYYLTRDPEVLDEIRLIRNHIAEQYYGRDWGMYRWTLSGGEAQRQELVAQLDQANAYLLMLAPLMPEEDRAGWRDQLVAIARIMRDRFYDPASGMFLGALAPNPAAPAERCDLDRDHTDFGHTIKTYWMIYLIGRLAQDDTLTAFAQTGATDILGRAFLNETGSWATQPLCGDGVNRTSTWWASAELNQAAATFGLADPALLRFLPDTYRFWLSRMVDREHGEVWHEVVPPDMAPGLTKLHLWKNGFHTAEHALIAYITTRAIRGEPVQLFFAFPSGHTDAEARPYYYAGSVIGRVDSALPNLPGFRRVAVTFGEVR